MTASIEKDWHFITLEAHQSDQSGNIVTQHYGNLIFTENDGFDTGVNVFK